MRAFTTTTLIGLTGMVFGLLIIAVINGCDCTTPPNSPPEQFEGFGMSAPEQKINPLGKLRVSEQTNVVAHKSYAGGYMETIGPQMRIIWKGNAPHGATTLDTVNATIGRMEWEQNQNEFASDQNARALFHLMQARQTLEGKVTTTEDGLPIIE